MYSITIDELTTTIQSFHQGGVNKMPMMESDGVRVARTYLANVISGRFLGTPNRAALHDALNLTLLAGTLYGVHGSEKLCSEHILLSEDIVTDVARYKARSYSALYIEKEYPDDTENIELITLCKMVWPSPEVPVAILEEINAFMHRAFTEKRLKEIRIKLDGSSFPSLDNRNLSGRQVAPFLFKPESKEEELARRAAYEVSNTKLAHMLTEFIDTP